MTHCQCDQFTPYFSATSSAIFGNPVFFTASTIVCHVRGTVPVPSSLEVHLSSKSSMQSSGLPRLLDSMMSMIFGSTRRWVPKYLHRASSRWLRTSTMSAGKGSNKTLWCCVCCTVQNALLSQTDRQCLAVEVSEEGGV